MSKAALNGQFSKDLLNALKHSGMDKENLNELVNIAAGLQKGGLKTVRVFPKGIPVPDSLHVQGIIGSSELNTVLASLLTKTPRLGGLRLFPYGIPWPEVFQVEVELGVAREGSEIGI